MNRPAPRSLLVASVALLLGVLAAPVAAQERPPLPPDTVAMPDTLPTPPAAAADTVASDTLRADTAALPDSAAAAAPEPDFIFDALQGLPGYTVTEYTGQSAIFETEDEVLRLRGPDAAIVREGQRLTAQDSIIYREMERRVIAIGEPTVSGDAQEIQGDTLFYDLDLARATVRGARTTITEGATWVVAGDVTSVGTDRLYAEESTFTSDTREEPQYYFEADEIAVIRERILVGRPARLYFRNVPVFWLPFIVQDLTRGRRSGLLTPEFGLNDIVRNSTGYNRRISNVGFFWALNEYMGTEIAGDWQSDTYTALRGALQYNWRRQFLRGSVNAKRYWEENGTNLTFSTSNSWQPDERTNLALQGSYASSNRFLKEISIDPRSVTQNLESTFSLDRRFDWGSVSLGARRSQQIADEVVDQTLPSFGINPNPITLFRAPPGSAQWYNNASLKFGLTGERSSRTFAGEDSLRSFPDNDELQLRANQSFSVGDLNLSSNATLNRNRFDILPELGTPPLVGETQRDERGSWNASLSYRIPLVGSSFFTPNISFAQEFKRDSLTQQFAETDGYVFAPLRFSFGTGVTPDLYGFFPGVGPFSAIRHHLQPGISYSYAPEVQQDSTQIRIFGPSGGRAQNRIQLSLRQTFEGKLRSPRVEEPAPSDTMADTVAARGASPAVPATPQKVTVLSISTSTVGYDFVKAANEQSGFFGETLSNTINSDYLQGLNLSFQHDLFDESGVTEPGNLGRFAPHLAQVNTSFSFGQGSAIFRRLFGRGDDADQPDVTPNTVVPDRFEGLDRFDEDFPDPMQPSTPTATGNPQQVGGGPWNVSLSYSWIRPREVEVEDEEEPRSRLFRREESQDLNGTLTFWPTPNWAVNWTTRYSLTDGEFGEHRLTLRRNLFRWQADFNFTRTIYGNTSFDVSVRLIDLPDLKIDYRERDIGGRDNR